VIPEAPLESTDHGLVPMREGWFVLNARDARWYHREGRSAVCVFEGEGDGESEFEQLGINISVLNPGETMAMYHWEADQEDFLVLSGEAILVIEGEERPLRQWDFVHCPPETKHVIVGAGNGPSVVLAVGARDKSAGGRPGWGGYTVDEAARRYGASVEEDTTDPKQAYARFARRDRTRYREGWLPG
jgi:quercetin dioxygenase-like cupin family protein